MSEPKNYIPIPATLPPGYEWRGEEPREIQPGGVYARITDAGRVVPVQNLAHTNTVGCHYPIYKIKTYADRVREWWPPWITAPWFAVDGTGNHYFFAQQKRPMHGRTFFVSKDSYYGFRFFDEATNLPAPPPLGDHPWQESPVRNPHLEENENAS
ncbi:MAG: hypothetical protein ACPGWS_01405 [Solirubrobacterales bacterium]